MVELIPAKYYVFNEEEFLQSSKYFHKKKRPQMSEQDAKEARIKAKKARLDPTARKTVEQIEKEAKDDTISQGMSGEGHDNDAHSDCEPLKLNLERIESVPLSELRERLKNKIREHRLKRKAPIQDGNADVQNRKLVTKKMKQEKIKKKKAKEKKGRSVAQTSPSNSHEMQDKAIDDNSVQFNKFDFGTSGKSNKTKKRNNLKKLLSKAEEQQQKIAQIVEQDPSKGREIKEKIKWQQALEKAQGIPRKDDPLLLQKTLKKREKQKKVSQKQWQERLEHQKQRKEKQQEKRRKHIQERIDVKKSKSKMSTKKKNRRKKVVIKS